MPTLTRAGIAHLYFAPIHPFEDGNGRVERYKKAYYAALERANKVNRIDDWLGYFSHAVLDALDYTRAGHRSDRQSQALRPASGSDERTPG
ncbi:Fic family protein [Thiocapsa sp. UBA6158]|uniref:Fic family protein n=1 Tax=Thiocapsa sp. UBA6158 TaxID=1947692 RepID=UPI0039C9B07F